MASVKFNRKIFEKEIGKLTEDLQNKIALFGTTVENLDEKEIELDVTPDRPDLLSYQGFKRSFLCFLGKKSGLKKYKVFPLEKNFEVKINSSVKAVRPFTVCAIVKGLKLNDEKIKELIEIQEKLHSTIGRRRKKMALGIYPLDNIKLPIDYLAIEPDKIKFKPLEANKEMSGLEILQRHPTGKEYAHLLKGKIKFPVFMDSNKKILSMPPIINSEETGRVNEKTKDIFVECSGFDEKILEKCLNIIVTTLADMGGKIYKMKVGTKVFPQLKNEKRMLSLKNTNKLLGLDLKEKELKVLVEKMGHNFLGNDVEIASWRTDILHEVDLIEDVAIAYGYDNLQPVIPKISTIGAEDSREAIKRKISDLLIGLGLLEVSNYHLTRKEDQFSNMGILEKNEKKVVELSDSKTDYSLLRKDLTHYLLKVISENSDAEYPQKIFETGIVFEFVNGVINEKEKLAVAVTPGNLTIVEQILNYLSDNLELNLILKEIDKNENHFIEGRVGGIYCGDSKIGEIGEIHPKILKNWKIKMPVSLFELDLTEIFKKFK